MNYIQTSYTKACPEKTRLSIRNVPWCNLKLNKNRKETRKNLNRAKITANWELYKSSLSEFNKEIRKTKKKNA